MQAERLLDSAGGQPMTYYAHIRTLNELGYSFTNQIPRQPCWCCNKIATVEFAVPLYTSVPNLNVIAQEILIRLHRTNLSLE